MRADQVGEIVISWLERDAVAVACLPRNRKEQPKQRRKVFLDVGRDDPPERYAALDLFDARVESRQRDDGLDPMLANRALELLFGIERIERSDDGAELPGGELGDDDDLMMWAGLYHLYLTSLPVRQFMQSQPASV